MIKAPITPGIHAQSVSRKTIKIEPQPLSITANGGKMIHKMTRQIDILVDFLNQYQRINGMIGLINTTSNHVPV